MYVYIYVLFILEIFITSLLLPTFTEQYEFHICLWCCFLTLRFALYHIHYIVKELIVYHRRSHSYDAHWFPFVSPGGDILLFVYDNDVDAKRDTGLLTMKNLYIPL